MPDWWVRLTKEMSQMTTPELMHDDITTTWSVYKMATADIIDMDWTSPSGRPKASPVWDFFHYNCENENNESVCQVNNGEKICGVKIKGKNPTNLKQHLSRYHKPKYETVLLKEEEAKSKKKSSQSLCKKKVIHRGQNTIDKLLQPKKFSPDSEKHKKIATKMAIFIGSAYVSHTLVENDEFRELIYELEPRYVPPGRGGVRSDLFKLVSTMKSNIGKLMAVARQIHFCCDIWSKKGLTEAFLGMVAHFHANGESHKVTLAVRNIYGSHTASNVLSVVKVVLEEWHIRGSVVGKMVTDNGSNMVKAFQQLAVEDLGVDSDEEISDCSDGNSTIDVNSDLEDDYDVEEVLSDEEVEELDETEKEVDIAKEVAEFDEKESDHDLRFSCEDYERLACFSHTLQLVVLKFDEVKPCKDALSKAKKLVAKVNKSVKATEMLRKLSRVKLRGDCPTRWSSTFLLLERLVKVKVHLEEVLKRLSGMACSYVSGS